MRLAVDVESAGATFGIAGAMLLALAIPQSRWAWCLLLGSNLCWLVFAHRHKYRKLLRQTLVFTASSLLGILNSFLPGNPVQAWLTALLS
ncbi:MAG: hypothetical protein HYX47_12935 [Burkholderiales bacterium]|nr:hypothetical protein [Burkholderiales bacterium]